MAYNRIDYEEIVLSRLLSMTFLAPHAWSEMIMYADQLFMDDEEARDEMNRLIFEVERLVFETEVYPVEDEDGKLVWLTRIKGDFSLYDIEMACESNLDFNAYFEKEDGTQVSKFDVERRLDKLRKWLFTVVRQKAQGRRFQRFR